MQLHRNSAAAGQSQGLLQQRPRRTVLTIACKCNVEDSAQSTKACSRRQTLHTAVAGVAAFTTAAAAACSPPAIAAENDFVSTPSGLSYLDVRQGDWQEAFVFICLAALSRSSPAAAACCTTYDMLHSHLQHLFKTIYTLRALVHCR